MNNADIHQAVERLIEIVEQKREDIFNICIREIARSVLEGSPEYTGSLGVPVDVGHAKSSISQEKFGTYRWRIWGTGISGKDGSPVGYLEAIEKNLRGVTFHKGGPHFFELTVNGFPKIFAAAVAEVAE